MKKTNSRLKESADMLYLGFLLVSVGAGIIVYGECEKIKRRAGEYSETLALLVYLRGAVASGIAPAEAVASFFKKGHGEALPWLFSHVDKERLTPFFRARKLLDSPSLLLGEDKSALAEYFADLGLQGVARESEKTEKIIAKIEKSEEAVRTGAEKSVKSAWVLFVSSAIGLLIVML